ncbi:hypothetical protein WA026_020640 [Henosepilachna vigintioctopunctata]|uniref:Mpv17-like protein n=1 Tax=Henosepilachna vigintioctopunctata TaxID=420089 RepID=A0AAW1UUR9_9CUCU
MRKYFRVVKCMFKNYPVVSNSIIYGSLCVGAEFSQQCITKKLMSTPPQPIDTDMVARYAIYGTTIGGPLLAVWYRWLDNKFVGTSIKIISRKLLIDQFFMTPQLLVIFYVAMSVMEKKSNLFEECRQKFLPTFKNSCMFWLPVQSINFLLVPPAFRVTYVGCCSFAWVNILCWIKRQEY